MKYLRQIQVILEYNSDRLETGVKLTKFSQHFLAQKPFISLLKTVQMFFRLNEHLPE